MASSFCPGPRSAGRRNAPYKRFRRSENLGAGGIHFRRASKNRGPRRMEHPVGTKKKMRSLGSVQIPTDTCPQAGVSERNRRKAAALGAEMAFLAVLKLDE